MKIDVVIPVYRPGAGFLKLLKRLQAQSLPVHEFIIMNTEQALWETWEKTLKAGSLPENMRLFHVSKEDFDHGATRNAGIEASEADICVCMTHDALPADHDLLFNLVRALCSREDVAVAYARQLPSRDCSVIEKYTRAFNYPKQGRIKTKQDLPKLGIKTYFCSNVCAAYWRARYLELGGFLRKTIFNEDMIFAAAAMEHGYGVAYAADARVIHSHHYTVTEQFRRNFDLAVSQADHPEVFAGVRSEGEGIRLVRQTASYLIKSGNGALVWKLVLDSGAKYAGYLLGKRYRDLPKAMIMICTMNKNYWRER